MSKSAKRRPRVLLWISLILAVTSLEYVPAVLATKETKTFCKGLATGTSLADVRSRATLEDFSVSPVREGTWMIEHRWSIGRAYCVTHFDPSGNLSSTVIGD